MIRDALADAVRDALAALGVDPPPRPFSSSGRPAASTATGRRTSRWPRPRPPGGNPASWRPAGRVAQPRAPPPHVESGSRSPGRASSTSTSHDSWLHDVLARRRRGGRRRLRPARRSARGERVQIEFVSANPTGPIHVGNGWFASYGDALARLLERCGYDVTREYYVNDTGGQIRRLGASVLARPRPKPVPEDGYPSRFVKGLAAALRRPRRRRRGRPVGGRAHPRLHQPPDGGDPHPLRRVVQPGVDRGERRGRRDGRGAARPRAWCSRRTARRGCAPPTSATPARSGCCARPNGDYTYLAGDIAYHRNKFLVRGFDRVIDVWGADHQGQVASLQAGGRGARRRPRTGSRCGSAR